MDILRKKTLLRKDFIIIRNNFTLSDAITHVQQRKILTNRYPVTIFKRVLSIEQNKDIDVAAYIKACDSYKIFSHKFEIVADGIQQVILLNETANKDHFKLSHECFLNNSRMMTDETYAIKVFNKYFKLNRDSNFSTQHFQSNVFGPNKQPYLKFDKSLLLNGGPMPGINIPSWDVSYPGSVIPFRDCHRNIPYINLLLQGDLRIYAFIPSPFIKHFAKKLQTYINSDCPFKLFHNSGCIVNFELLLEWNIPVQFYVQEPGDLIFINAGVLFCAINNGLNVTESIYFCSDVYFNKTLSINCKCGSKKANSLEYILSKFEIKQSNKSLKKIYKCKQKNCIEGMAIYSSKAFYEHCVKVHSLKLFKCENSNCSKTFTRKHDAKRHFEYYHKKNYSMMKKCSQKSLLLRREQISCQICDKHIIRKSLRRHLALKHMMKGYMLNENVKEHYQAAIGGASRRLKFEMDDVGRQAVSLNFMPKSKRTICNETVLLHSELTKTRKLLNDLSNVKENLIIEIEKFRKKLQELEQQKSQDTLHLKLELQESKQVIKDKDKKLAEFEKIKKEFQKQENQKDCHILDLKLKLDKAETMIYEISMDRDKRLIQIDELRKELQEMEANIEKICSETADKQIQFCESLHLIVKSPNLKNGANIKCHKYALRNRIYS